MSTQLKSKVHHWLKNAQYFFFPGTCIICKQVSCRTFDLCHHCENHLPLIASPCQRCGLTISPASYTSPHYPANIFLCGGCLTKPPPFQHSISAFYYHPPIKQLITQFKFQGKLYIGRVLAKQLLIKLQQFYQNKPYPILLIPVPLHHQRLRQRGYNQAHELANYLGQKLCIPVDPWLCSRKHNTPAQSGLNAIERQENLRQAFDIKNKHFTCETSIAIVDDVVTTMSTVSELSVLLIKNGAKEIHVWSIARTTN